MRHTLKNDLDDESRFLRTFLLDGIPFCSLPVAH
jgi:hypothetical protein